MQLSIDPNDALNRSRRAFFQQSALGLSGVALSSMLVDDAMANPGSTHFPAVAKRIIFLHMTGGPSHVDLFDPKPVLNLFDGQPTPKEFVDGIEFGFITGKESLMGSPFQFSKHGQSGMDFSDQVPFLAEVADVGDPEIATRIAQYELAFRMQTSVPDLMDISGESPETLAMYGADPSKQSFANNCLLEDTIVVWAGELGRTPMVQDCLGSTVIGISSCRANGQQGRLPRLFSSLAA